MVNFEDRIKKNFIKIYKIQKFDNQVARRNL